MQLILVWLRAGAPARSDLLRALKAKVASVRRPEIVHRVRGGGSPRREKVVLARGELEEQHLKGEAVRLGVHEGGPVDVEGGVQRVDGAVVDASQLSREVLGGN